MLCINCGATLGDESAFCTECGQRVLSTTVAEAKEDPAFTTTLPETPPNDDAREPGPITPDQREETLEPETVVIDAGIETTTDAQPVPSAIRSSNPNIVTLDPVHAPETSQSTQPDPHTAAVIIKKTVKALISVIFAIIAFGLVCALIPLTVLRPENFPAIVDNLDVSSILDETGSRALIEDWLSRPPLSNLDVSIEEIENYLEREDLSDTILEAIETAVGDSIFPYLVFSVYPLIIAGILCVLIIFDIFMLHRKTLRLAFLTTGIPVALAGFLFLAIGLSATRFPGLLWSSELGFIAKYIGGIAELFVFHGLICFAAGIVSIAVYFIAMAVRSSRRAGTSGSVVANAATPTEAWRVTGIIVNFTLLMACMVISFLYYLYIPW